MVNGEVQVVGPSSAGQAESAQPGDRQAVAIEDFEVPSQLRQQFIEVRSYTCSASCGSIQIGVGLQNMHCLLHSSKTDFASFVR